MKILVCVKIIKGDVNPFDECALEAALRLSDDVTVLSMGPVSCREPLQKLTRLGARCILLSDSDFAGSDTLATSYVLSEAAKKAGFDLIICGRQSIDGDTGQVGAMMSHMLDIRLYPFVTKLEGLRAHMRSGKTEDIKLPAIITVERINTLRFPSIRSRAGEVTVWDNSVLGADRERCGISGSPTRVIKSFENESGKRHCRFIKLSELDEIIKNYRRKPRAVRESHGKLKKVWCVGEEAAAEALCISDDIKVLEENNPLLIAKYAKEEKPNAILWKADLEGRTAAPICAAELSAGLCADCTELETDGETLFMYRPAGSGKIYAKIKCITAPCLATVRTAALGGRITVSAGKGAKDALEAVHTFAKKYGAEIGASRAAVDMGLAPYEAQIGLTGKSISSDIYIAVGISGAVQHMCAAEGCGLIIAVNSDKNADIFDYADIGIVCDAERLRDI